VINGINKNAGTSERMWVLMVKHTRRHVS